MHRAILLVACLVAGCATGAPTPSPLSDAERLWCATEDNPLNGVITLSEIDSVIASAKALALLPPELEVVRDPGSYRDTIQGVPLWSLLPGRTLRPDGTIDAADATANPEAEAVVRPALESWRTTPEYAQACRAAYDLEGPGR